LEIWFTRFGIGREGIFSGKEIVGSFQKGRRTFLFPKTPD